jgi:hypothetical protein
MRLIVHCNVTADRHLHSRGQIVSPPHPRSQIIALLDLREAFKAWRMVVLRAQLYELAVRAAQSKPQRRSPARSAAGGFRRAKEPSYILTRTHVLDNLMTTSLGRASFASTSTALIIPTGTGQAAWVQYCAPFCSVWGMARLVEIS